MTMLHDLNYNSNVLFSVQELACPHCGRGKLAPGFATALLEYRIRLDETMILNSACRCKEYNDSIDGAHPRSLHVFDYPYHHTEGCCAVDVRTLGRPESYRDRLIDLARELQWSIGFGSTFLHLDTRVDYTALPRAEFDY